MSEEKKEGAPTPAEPEKPATEEKEGKHLPPGGKPPFVSKFAKGNNPFTNPGGGKGGKGGYRGPAGPVGGRTPPRSGSRGT